MRIPVAATIPNITMPAPPSTNGGMHATMYASFGNRPRSTRITPPAAHTQRLRTPVMPTNPTFCENDVYGNVLRMPPSSVPRASARSPLVRSVRDSGMPISSARVRNMPVDSIITTTMTRHIVTTATGSKIGAPN